MKTLKDMQCEIVGEWCNCGDEDNRDKTIQNCLDKAIHIKDLKQEAIKWIRYNDFYVSKQLNNSFDDDVNIKIHKTLAVNSWIKHFFNITDEDLNDEKT